MELVVFWVVVPCISVVRNHLFGRHATSIFRV